MPKELSRDEKKKKKRYDKNNRPRPRIAEKAEAARKMDRLVGSSEVEHCLCISRLKILREARKNNIFILSGKDKRKKTHVNVRSCLCC